MELIQELQAAAGKDPMTGLLNKESSQKQIGAMCNDTRGVLMLIDLDSFKLVNEQYGQSTGDKVLRKFAEIIRAAIRAGDIVGRLDEDEFIAYCQYVSEENIVSDKIKYINEELVKAAREILGEDMSAPLGISVGAVFAPLEGKEYQTLFAKASQALALAKQNGKHTYSLFSKYDSEQAQKMPSSDIEKDMMLLSEQGKCSGALALEEEQFKLIYRFLCRVEENYRVGNHYIVFNIIPDNSEQSETPKDIGDKFFECIRESLRVSDVVSKNGANFIRVLLLESEFGNSSMVIRRILENWKNVDTEGEYIVTYEMEMVRA